MTSLDTTQRRRHQQSASPSAGPLCAPPFPSQPPQASRGNGIPSQNTTALCPTQPAAAGDQQAASNQVAPVPAECVCGRMVSHTRVPPTPRESGKKGVEEVMSPAEQAHWASDILCRYGLEKVGEAFDPGKVFSRRIDFLVKVLRATGKKGFVLGISGGVDSLVAGAVAQRACQVAREQGLEARFHAVRLPYGEQIDEDDAHESVRLIMPDSVHAVDIAPACQALRAKSVYTGDKKRDELIEGNLRARIRMVVQYNLAAATDALVLGTDHPAEAIMGFFTKFGDGACDVTVLDRLSKGQIRAIAKWFGAPPHLAEKKAMAGLEDSHPWLGDEEVLGVSYDVVDRFLAGEAVPDDARQVILSAYKATRHKRRMPLSIADEHDMLLDLREL